MKIACQSCQAKYTIADEKVLGRVVKIRCKKCSATIVINGNEVTDTGAAHQPAPAEDPTTVQAQGGAYDYTAQQGAAAEEWTVNVADGDQRTMRLADIVAEYKSGVVNEETYCWKDGMPDWLPLREIESLAGPCGVGGVPAPLAMPPMPSAAAAAPGLGALFGGGGGTPYPGPAAAEANGGGLYAAAPAARRAGGRGVAGADLFGNVNDAGGENDVMTSAPQGTPQAHEGDQKLTGQRNENSVLFSLAALTQNAPKEDIPAPQGDGSGLIDIRALASTMAPKSERKPNHVDDIMNLGGGGAFSAALAAPVLAPPPVDAGVGFGGDYGAPQARTNKVLIALVAALGLIVVVMLALFLTRKPASEAATDTSPTASGIGAAGAVGLGSVAANDSASAAPTAAPPDSAAAPATAAAPDTTKPPPTTVASRPRGGGGGAGGFTPHNDNPLPPPPPASKPPAGLEGAMGAAVGAPPAATPPPQPQGSTDPFDRGAAAAALSNVNVQSCKKGDGPTGPGHVSVTFSPNGSVSSATADQPPYAGTAVGGCVAAKFRGARVPPFGGGSVKVGKSFNIN